MKKYIALSALFLSSTCWGGFRTNNLTVDNGILASTGTFTRTLIPGDPGTPTLSQGAAGGSNFVLNDLIEYFVYSYIETPSGRAYSLNNGYETDAIVTSGFVVTVTLSQVSNVSGYRIIRQVNADSGNQFYRDVAYNISSLNDDKNFGITPAFTACPGGFCLGPIPNSITENVYVNKFSSGNINGIYSPDTNYLGTILSSNSITTNSTVVRSTITSLFVSSGVADNFTTQVATISRNIYLSSYTIGSVLFVGQDKRIHELPNLFYYDFTTGRIFFSPAVGGGTSSMQFGGAKPAAVVSGNGTSNSSNGRLFYLGADGGDTSEVTATTRIGGAAGGGSLQGGFGGISTGGTGENRGGAGGTWSWTGGTGGAIAAGGTTSRGGGGGSLTFNSGSGAQASGASVANIGGAGASLTMASGSGGNASGTGAVSGSGGSVTINAANSGLATTRGAAGNVFIFAGSGILPGGVYLGINGAAVPICNVGIGTNNATALLTVSSSAVDRASFRVMQGTAPTTPNFGDIWNDSNGQRLKVFQESKVETFATLESTQTWTATQTVVGLDVAQNGQLTTNGQLVGLVFSTYSPVGAYNFTTGTATIAVGTSSSTLTLTSSGTYRIEGVINLRYTGATFAANQFVTMNLYRQNNTPGLLSNSQSQEETGVVTTITQQFGQFKLGPIFYTTTNTDDILSIRGSITATPAAGNFQATEANFMATRMY